ncbi:MAG: hypothetical protein ABIT36_05040 [Steroidobacteraceae bacterium]
MNSRHAMKFLAVTAMAGTATFTAAVTSASSAAADALAAAEAEVRLMDMDRDGKLSATEHANGTKRMFGKMDANDNGIVTAAEMDAVQGPATPAQPMSSQDKIKVIDANKDGSLSAEEHAAGSRSMFEKMDKDHDGFLTAAEIQKGRSLIMKAGR